MSKNASPTIKGIPKARVESATPEGSRTPDPLPAEQKIPVTPYRVFELCIERARNLIRLHEAAHGRQAKPEKYLADAHRGAIVLAISALDAYVRTLVIDRIGVVLRAKHAVLPASLAEKIKSFLQADGLLEAARKDDLLTRVEKAFRKDFEKRTFQGVEPIAVGLQMVGLDDVFKAVAAKARTNEDQLKKDLDDFTQRRHSIAHRGDYDLTSNPPREVPVTKKYASDCIALVELVARHVNILCGEL